MIQSWEWSPRGLSALQKELNRSRDGQRRTEQSEAQQKQMQGLGEECQYWLGTDLQESSSEERHLEVLVDDELPMSQ